MRIEIRAFWQSEACVCEETKVREEQKGDQCG